jgi:Xaa-Pro aminopeptidase
MSLATRAVDHEVRVDFDRLRRYRSVRLQDAMRRHGLAAVICFDPNNVRYATGSYQGEWSRDKMVRYAVVPAGGEAILFDSRTLTHVNRHPGRYPWLVDHVRNSDFLWRGSYQPQEPRADKLVAGIRRALDDQGISAADGPIGVDVLDMQFLAAAQRAQLALTDGQQALLDARLIKSDDEVELMRIAAAIAEGAFFEFSEWLRPGLEEGEIVAFLSRELIRRGSEQVECIAVATGPNTNPHASLFSNRLVRPGDVVYIDIMHAYNGYRTCYYRTFVAGSASDAQHELYARCRGWLYDSIAVMRDGISSREVASVWPAAEETGSFGVRDESTGFALNLGHGLGMTIWEKPIINREVSFENPFPIQSGMVFALETYAGSQDGTFGVRLEEEVLVTEDGCELLTKFPSDDLTESPRR